MKKFVLVVLALVAFVISGCAPVDTKCPVPGCTHKHTTDLTYRFETKVAKAVVYGDTNISVEKWLAAWSPEDEAEGQLLLAHLRYYVTKESVGLDKNYRKAGWSDADITWSSDRMKTFIYKLNK